MLEHTKFPHNTTHFYFDYTLGHINRHYSLARSLISARSPSGFMLFPFTEIPLLSQKTLTDIAKTSETKANSVSPHSPLKALHS